MIGIALVLAALAIADLVSGGLAGQPVSVCRSIMGLIISLVIVVMGGYCYEFNWVVLVGTAVYSVVVVGGWLTIKTLAADDNDRKKPQLALAWLGVFFLVTLFLTPFWPGQLMPVIEQWVSKFPFTLSERWEPVDVFTYIGVILFLSAPANSIVRLTLTVVGTDWRKSQKKLRGGRLIGVLERWLIFGLATAGEPTAAALIVSAKSLLRFPELNRAGVESDVNQDQPAEVDIVTEYFLLGSLLSWSLALFPALMFV